MSSLSSTPHFAASQLEDRHDAAQNDGSHDPPSTSPPTNRNAPHIITGEDQQQDRCPECSSRRWTISLARFNSPDDRGNAQNSEEVPSPIPVAEFATMESKPDRARVPGTDGAEPLRVVAGRQQGKGEGKDRWGWLKALVRIVRRIGRDRRSRVNSRRPVRPSAFPHPMPEMLAPSSSDGDNQDPSTTTSFGSGEDSSTRTQFHSPASPSHVLPVGGSGLVGGGISGRSPTMFAGLNQAHISGGAFYAAQNITIYVNPVYHSDAPQRLPPRTPSTQLDTHRPR
ncbi:hypothetical protein BKA70DRAFT_1220994 [Coprinopsis sp. MPI-PUGE-AT-0042]|nr:hypothetical protein BKA70DRAFT_1220994 [Coprinopsis sp. MPI-PUGE-AT-0042]